MIRFFEICIPPFMRQWCRLLPEGVERRGRNCRACRIRQTVSNFGEVDVGAFWLPCWRKSCRERGDAARSRSRQATNVARLIRRAGRTPRSETPFLGFVLPCWSWFPCGLGPQATGAVNCGYGSLPVLYNPCTFGDQSSGNMVYSTEN